MRDPRTDAVRWSPAMYELMGVPFGRFAGTLADFHRRVHPDDRRRVEQAGELLREHPRRFSGELRIVRPDGAIRRLRSSGEALEGPGGSTVLIAGAVEDISERDVRDPDLARKLGIQAG